MPPKRRFRPPKSEQEEKLILEECTKWAFKIFSEWQIARVNKDPCIEQRSFKIDIDKVQTDIGYEYRQYECRDLKLLADKICPRSRSGQG